MYFHSIQRSSFTTVAASLSCLMLITSPCTGQSLDAKLVTALQPSCPQLKPKVHNGMGTQDDMPGMHSLFTQLKKTNHTQNSVQINFFIIFTVSFQLSLIQSSKFRWTENISQGSFIFCGVTEKNWKEMGEDNISAANHTYRNTPGFT